jgi:hypothetical protein
VRTPPGDRAAPPLPLVLFERVTAEIAQVLRAVGCGYADGAGVLHLPKRPGPATELAPATEPAPDRVAESVRWAIGEQVADDSGRFALIDLYCGGRDPLAARDLSGLARPPEQLIVNPIGLLGWLATLSVTRRAHSAMLAYLLASDPDEILPFLPWHPKGPEFVLEDGEVRVRGASVVSAVQVREARDWRTGGDVLVLPGGSTAVLGGS